MTRRPALIAAICVALGSIAPTFAAPRWTPDSRLFQPGATDYCVNGVCLGMPLDQLPTLLPALSPEPGHWADIGDHLAMIARFKAMAALKNPCGDQLRDARAGDRHEFAYWTGLARGQGGLRDVLRTAWTGQDTLQPHETVVTVSAVPKMAQSDDSIFVVTKIVTRLHFAPDQARQLFKTVSSSWSALRPEIGIDPLTGTRWANDFQEPPQTAHGRVFLEILPRPFLTEAENAERYSAGSAQFTFQWDLPQASNGDWPVDLLPVQPFCARPQQTTTPLESLLK